MSTEPDTRLQTKLPCLVHGRHMPTSHINERHHIWPLGHGGPDVADNIVVICATGHNNIHLLLTQLLAFNGSMPYSALKQFSLEERRLAKLGFDRIKRGAL